LDKLFSPPVDKTVCIKETIDIYMGLPIPYIHTNTHTHTHTHTQIYIINLIMLLCVWGSMMNNNRFWSG
jgi:hypothetical protein